MLRTQIAKMCTVAYFLRVYLDRLLFDLCCSDFWSLCWHMSWIEARWALGRDWFPRRSTHWRYFPRPFLRRWGFTLGKHCESVLGSEVTGWWLQTLDIDTTHMALALDGASLIPSLVIHAPPRNVSLQSHNGLVKGLSRSSSIAQWHWLDLRRLVLSEHLLHQLHHLDFLRIVGAL